MFGRRLLSTRSSPVVAGGFVRTITNSAANARRPPALADITPAGVASFEARQKEFRERLAEINDKKKKEAS